MGAKVEDRLVRSDHVAKLVLRDEVFLEGAFALVRRVCGLHLLRESSKVVRAVGEELCFEL